MSVSRRDFNYTAYTIKKLKNPKDRAKAAVLFANHFKKQNPRFDVQKFYSACGFIKKYRSVKVRRKMPNDSMMGFFNW